MVVVVVVVGLWIVEGRRRISFVFMLFFIFYWVWLWWETQKRKSDEFCKFVWDLEFSLFYGNFIFWVVKKERNHGGNWERENHTEIEKVTGGGMVLKKWTGGGALGIFAFMFWRDYASFLKGKIYPPSLNWMAKFWIWLLTCCHDCVFLFFPSLRLIFLNWMYICLSKFY